ncbi:MAG TPA: fused MFS/spermidine synthase [Nitrospiria bacterium]|nr:fused MFS/spermidine synthase [Nitrospiria bacterium]
MSPFAWLSLVFVLSGASGLIYQVVWGRLLVLVFGSTTIAVTTVLAVFMGGLAIGSALGGRVVDRVRRPLLAYAVIEAAVAAYALAIPWLLHAVVPVYQAVWRELSTSPLSVMAARVGLVSAILAVPTVLMGATLPVISRVVAAGATSIAGRVSALYTLNTAGAIAGAVGAGFLLLPAVGVTATIVVAAVGNAAAAITAWALVRRGFDSTSRSPRVDAAGSESGEAGVRRRVAVTLAISGAAALVNEVVWTRALSLVLGSSVYAFSAMLTTFLSGLAAGAACGTWLVRRTSPRFATLGAVQLATALASLVTLALIGRLPLALIAAVGSLRGLGADVIPAVQFALSFLVMFLPTFGFGVVFPVALSLAVRSPDAVGTSVGRLYAANTAGAIAGAVVAGFVLVPLVGVPGSLVAAAATCAVLGLWLVVGDRSIARRLAWGGVLGSAVLGALVLGAIPRWSGTLMSSGVYWNLPRYLALADREGVEGVKKRLQQGETLFEREGLTATVVVTRTEPDGRVLTINGRTESGDPFMRTQVAIGHWPMWFARSADRVLIIGLGSGATTGSVLRHPVGRVDVVELERAVIDASRRFEPENGLPLTDTRVRVWPEDGRNFLLLSPERYDVIISQPSLPWVAGAATLFTEEFFAVAASRLEPGGVFGQWVAADAMGREDLRAVLAAFARSFPSYVVLEPTPGDLFVVGSPSRLALDEARVAAGFNDPGIAADLKRVDFFAPADVFATVIGHTGTIGPLLDGVEPNRDDNAAVEFSGPRAFARMLEGRRSDGVAWLRGLAK